MQEIINRINRRHEELRKELDNHNRFMEEHQVEFEERSRNINKMLDEISSDLDALLEDDNSIPTEQAAPEMVKEMKIRVYINKETSYIHIHQESDNETEYINITIENKVNHGSVLDAFVRMWNCDLIKGSWNNLTDEKKIEISDEFNRIVGERYASDDVDRKSIIYVCTLDDDDKIVAVEAK